VCRAKSCGWGLTVGMGRRRRTDFGRRNSGSSVATRSGDRRRPQRGRRAPEERERGEGQARLAEKGSEARLTERW
jgi:hypothetical protein